MSQDKPAPAPIKPKAAKTRKRPRKITPDYLHNAGLYYLQRFASSSGNFRQVMMRKVRRSCMEHKEQDFEACRLLVDQLVEKFQASGLLDDDTYLRASIQSLRRRGFSRQAIISRLTAKGLKSELIQIALSQNSDEPLHDPELVSALIHARKKKYGPFSAGNNEDKEKIVSSFACKGFKYETVRIVMKMKDTEAENILGNRPLT